MNPFGLFIIAIGLLLGYAGARAAFGGSSSTTAPAKKTGTSTSSSPSGTGQQTIGPGTRSYQA